MNAKPGIIALDIDGTITVDHHPIQPDVVTYLNSLYALGWKFIFITGRTFVWGDEVLRKLPFPYYFAVQNGAITLEMPSRNIVNKKYLTNNIIPIMEEICRDEPSDFVVYTGYENNDICYFRSAYFDDTLLDYLKSRSVMMKEKWIDLYSFDDMSVKEFSSVKCFGEYASALRIAEKIDKKLGLHIPLIRDPYNNKYYVAQATHPKADKGLALLDVMKLFPDKTTVIAAGDDLNDLSMLNIASCKVVMNTAPKELLKIADVIAPSALDNGIIEGLKQAIQYRYI